jgi:hypothetical protein
MEYDVSETKPDQRVGDGPAKAEPTPGPLSIQRVNI